MIKKQHLSNFQAVSLVTITVDGDPKDLCLNRSAGYGLDKQAALTVEKYRFSPATLNGKPVPVRMSIEVNLKY